MPTLMRGYLKVQLLAIVVSPLGAKLLTGEGTVGAGDGHQAGGGFN